MNEAPITGESLPVDKGPGDEVYAGTINGRGSLDLEVIRVGRDTRLARIIHLVEAAQARRAPVQSFVDRFARVYTPAVIALAAVVAVVPPLVARRRSRDVVLSLAGASGHRLSRAPSSSPRRSPSSRRFRRRPEMACSSREAPTSSGLRTSAWWRSTRPGR